MGSLSLCRMDCHLLKTAWNHLPCLALPCDRHPQHPLSEDLSLPTLVLRSEDLRHPTLVLCLEDRSLVDWPSLIQPPKSTDILGHRLEVCRGCQVGCLSTESSIMDNNSNSRPVPTFLRNLNLHRIHSLGDTLHLTTLKVGVIHPSPRNHTTQLNHKNRSGSLTLTKCLVR